MPISSLTIRPRRSAAKKQGEKLWVEPWVVWRDDAFRELHCPACAKSSVMEKQLDASPPFEPRKRYSLYRCLPCGTLHYPDVPVFEYESRKDADIARKFYVEIGAGLDAMIAPLAWAEPERVKSYLEVGGGYGFSVDFASRGLKWQAANIDPSFIAQTGAADLGHTHLPEYLNAENPLPNGPFDRVLSSEVIEHVPDPDPFLAALASAVSPGGALVITTPDAGAVHKAASHDALRPIIVAGHHIVIFTEAGLEAALRRAGFDHVTTIARDQTLYAVASRHTIDVDFSARPDRNTYRTYLKARRDDLQDDPTLHAGFSVRLLKECVHSGNWDEAREAFNNLNTRWRNDYGLDLTAPNNIRPRFTLPEKNRGRAIRTYAANYSFNLAVALFYAARLYEQDGDLEKAEGLYRACVRAARTGNRVFRAMFAACRETEDAGQRAALHAAMLAAHHDPVTATREILAMTPDASNLPADLWDEARFKVFADGVLSGNGSSVEPLAVIVRALLSEKLAAEIHLSTAAGYSAGALGIRAEQLQQAHEAAKWYAVAAAAMTVESEKSVFNQRRTAVSRLHAGTTAHSEVEAEFADLHAYDAQGRTFLARKLASKLLNPKRADADQVRSILGSHFAHLERYNTHVTEQEGDRN